MTLRAPILALSPLMPTIRAETGLSSGAAGMLTTIPLLCFAAVSPLAPWLSRRFGMEWTFLGALTLCVAGMVVRSLPRVWLLFGGTVLLGCGIPVLMVLLPGLVKREDPRHVGAMTAVFSAAIQGSGALGAGLTLPIRSGLGGSWRAALSWSVVLCLPAAALMIPWIMHARQHPVVTPATTAWHDVLRSPLAWAVTMYLATQSWLLFSVAAWLPTFLDAHGVPLVRAGSMLAMIPLFGIAGSFGAPLLISRLPSHWLILAGSAACALGLAGLLVTPTTALALWVILIGLAVGVMQSMALAFIGLGATDAGHAAALSSMAQSIGFGVAATSPFLMGIVADWTGSWTVPFVIMVLAVVPVTITGWLSAVGVTRRTQATA